MALTNYKRPGISVRKTRCPLRWWLVAAGKGFCSQRTSAGTRPASDCFRNAVYLACGLSRPCSRPVHLSGGHDDIANSQSPIGEPRIVPTAGVFSHKTIISFILPTRKAAVRGLQASRLDLSVHTSRPLTAALLVSL